MLRILVWVLIAVLLVGGIVWLSNKNVARQPQRVEKVIPADALPK